MTDERYVFNQDVAERSKMKTGAFYKKNGSKSKRCTLPSDYLTVGQKKKLNGECKSINLSKPITNFREFRSYPYSMQQEYIQNLITNYGARKIDICEMLGTQYSNFTRYMKTHDITVDFGKIVKGRHSKMDDRFLEFITRPENTEEAESVPKKTDEEILKERFGIEPKKEEAEVKKTEEKPEEKLVESAWLKEALTKPVKTEIEGCGVLYDAPPAKEEKFTCMFSAMTSVQMKLKGSREEILNAFNALLGDGIEYRLSFDLSAFAKGEVNP